MKYAIKTVAREYDSRLVRWYVRARFTIINVEIFRVIAHYLPSSGRLLTIGCGFGLFECVLALHYPELQITGVDSNQARINAATRIAQKLHLPNVSFHTSDANNLELSQEYDAVVMIDLLHHLGPPNEQHQLLELCLTRLTPNGVLIIKDIHKRSKLKLAFTWFLDKIMTVNDPLYYFDDTSLVQFIESKGLRALSMDLDDWMPYPHILFVGLNGYHHRTNA